MGKPENWCDLCSGVCLLNTEQRSQPSDDTVIQHEILESSFVLLNELSTFPHFFRSPISLKVLFYIYAFPQSHCLDLLRRR